MVNDIIQEHFGRTDPVATIDDNKTADGFRYVDFLVPGLLALSILTTSLFGTGMTIVSNRRENLLKLYMTTPMKPFEYILSHIAGRFIIFAFEIASLMLAAYIFFNFRMEGPWLSFLGFAAVGTAMFTAMGILIGSRTRHTIVFSSMVNLTTIALMILGGVWFSRESFPQWLFTLSSYLPLTPLVEGLRAIAIEGADISQTIPQLVLMIVYGLVCAFLAKVSFKWF
jgi:ABC transporter DrrB family efflux protein